MNEHSLKLLQILVEIFPKFESLPPERHQLWFGNYEKLTFVLARAVESYAPSSPITSVEILYVALGGTLVPQRKVKLVN